MEIKLKTNQVLHGLEYEGTIELPGRTFNYQLKFGVPIDQLDDQIAPSKNDEEAMKKHARGLFQFILVKDGENIELSDKLFGFLLQTVGMLSLNFYNNPQTKANNTEGVMSGLFDPSNPLSSMLGVKASIGMSSSVTIDEEHLPSELK